MDVLRSIEEARARRQHDRDAGRVVGFVPTMGALHEGHLSLVEEARKHADTVWASVFVNPTQFGPGEDFERYPRDLESDARLLEDAGTAALFAPSAQAMYPRPPRVEIGFGGLEKVLCGAHRAGHFAGVGLVVSKLFNIVEPDVAVFGQKDAQQAVLIRRLAVDLDFPVEIVVAPTVREPDGLAMSSRNAYLSVQQRRAAPVLYRALRRGADAVEAGEGNAGRVEEIIAATVASEPLLELEYARCVDADELVMPQPIVRPVLLALAARAGSTRLIDNVIAVPPGR